MLARPPLEPLDADEIRAASAILRAAGHLRDRVSSRTANTARSRA